MRTRILIAGILIALVALAGCSGHTSPPVTNLTSTSATIHADVAWKQSDNTNGNTWWWEWSSDNFQTISSSAHLAVPPCSSDPCSGTPSKDISGLTPGTTYQYRLAAGVNGNTYYGDSNGFNASDDPPYEYDSFTTLPGYPSIADASATLDGDFDNFGELTPSSVDGGWDNTVFEHGGSAGTTTGNPTPQEGTYAAIFQIPAGSIQERAEVSFNGFGNGPTTTMEELLYLPSVANNGPDHGVLTQTKMGSPVSGCFNGGLTYNPDDTPGQLEWATVDASCNSTHHGIGAPTLDGWEAIKVQETFGPTGSLTVWTDLDGSGPAPYVQKVSLPSVANAPAGIGVKYRRGLYADPNPSHETHVWGDGFRLICTANC